MSWRPARSISVLKAEVDRAHPNRPTGADGIIGDPAHAARASDHNPNAAGVVTAWDITTAPFCDQLAEDLRTLGKLRDGRVKYIIWKRRICSAENGWAWRPYDGADPHTGHIHLSVSADSHQYDRTDSWLSKIPHGGGGRIPGASAPTTQEDNDMTADQARQLAEVHAMLKALIAPRRADKADRDPNAIDLGDILTKEEGP